MNLMLLCETREGVERQCEVKEVKVKCRGTTWGLRSGKVTWNQVFVRPHRPGKHLPADYEEEE